MEASGLLPALALALLSLITASVRAQAMPRCLKVDACSCRLDSTNELISLQGLNGNSKLVNGVIGHDGYKYHFNPCQPVLNLDPSCSPMLDSAACQEAGADDFYSLGRVSSVSFEVTATSPSQVVFTYDGGTPDGVNIRQLQVTVMCDRTQTDDLVYVSEFTDWPAQHIVYYMTLNSKFGCPGYVQIALEDPSGISAGSIMTIIFFVLLIVYAAVFVAYGVAQQKTGLELVPNYSFWVALTGYIKEGATFVFTCDGRLGAGGGGAGGSGDKAYEQL